MSISSSADRLDEYEFFIRLVHDGEFTPLLWERKLGDEINIKGAKGRFQLQDDGRTCLLVASGTGLAPFVSMIETLRDRGQTRDLILLHGVSHDYDLAWRSELEALRASGSFPLRYAGTVSRPQNCPDWTGLTGRVESIIAAQLDEHALTPENTTIYLCGNPDMIEAVEADRGGARLPAGAGPQGAVLAQGEGALSSVADRFYLTTAIFYPSAGPALHSLFEAIGADAIARYQRLLGKDVRFLTGMDEHSANLERQATERGVEPRALVDEWAANWRAGFDRFEISYDRFIRTTDPDHARASTEMVRRALATGDIYKGTYAGWYCVGDNEFKTDSQIVDGHCPDHPTLELQWLEEENYFFRLSRYQAALEQLYREHPSFCEPEHFRNEVLGWLNDGVPDFSISRAGGTWGIPFPDDPAHRIYVWFDALTNYLTGAGFPDDPGSVRALVAGRRPRHRQEHHPLPLPLLAGDADERRAAAARRASSPTASC